MIPSRREVRVAPPPRGAFGTRCSALGAARNVPRCSRSAESSLSGRHRRELESAVMRTPTAPAAAAAAMALTWMCLACGSDAATLVHGSAGAGGSGAPVGPADTGAQDAGSHCSDGALRCDGVELQACSSDDWHTLQSCASGALCQAGLASGQCPMPACAPGETRCVGATPERCNRGRTDWESVERCATPDLCDAVAGRCL
jgi:hypothetical protein